VNGVEIWTFCPARRSGVRSELRASLFRASHRSVTSDKSLPRMALPERVVLTVSTENGPQDNEVTFM
jgi:hypothetical protein